MRLLCAAHVLPIPTDTGHAWRCLGLLRALADEHEVTFVTIRSPGATAAHERTTRTLLGDGSLMLFEPQAGSDGSAVDRLRRWGRAGAWRVPVAAAGHHDEQIARALASQAATHDAVVLLDNAVTIYWRSLGTARRRIADIHNVAGWSIAQVDTAGASVAMRARARTDVALMRSYERRWLGTMDAVTVTSPEEDDRLQRLYGVRASAVIPSTVDPPKRPQRLLGARRIGWIGLLGYGPNRNGLLRFVREAWAPMGEAGYELLVIGGGEGPVRSELEAHPGVRVLGFVESLTEVMESLGAAVIPVWDGAGVKLKTVTFMAAGIPVVSTPVGLEGVEARDGESALIADSPQGLARKLRDVLEDPAAAHRIGDAGRDLVLRELSWDAIGRRFTAVVSDAISAPARRSAPYRR